MKADRRIATALVGSAALLATLLLAFVLGLPALLPADFARTALAERMSAALQRPVTIERASLRLLPLPSVSIERMRAPAFYVPKAQARLSVWSLLRGRAVPVRLMLADARFDLSALPVATPASVREAAAELGVSRLELENSQLRRRGGRALYVARARFELDGKAVELSGNGRWNGRAVAWRADIGSLADLTLQTTLDLEFEADEARLQFSGRGSSRGPGRGRLEVSGGSLAQALAWLDLPSAGATQGAFSLSGAIERTAWGWEMGEATVRLGRADGEGSLAFLRESDGRGPSRVTGTLAFDGISPDLARAADAGSENGVAALADADIRFSTPLLRAGPAALEAVAATLRSENGTVRVEVGDALTAGGRLTGAITLSPDPDKPRRQVEVRLVDADLAALPLAIPGRRVTGRGDIQVAATWPREKAEIATTVRLDARDGTLHDFDLRTVARLGPDLVAGSALNGDTAFRTLGARARIERGILLLDDLRIAAAGLAARMSGRVDLSRGVPALRGEVASVGVATDVATGTALAPDATGFFVGGTLEAPLVVPLVQD